MVILETVTLVFGIGLSSAAVSDQVIDSMVTCRNYLDAQAKRYEMYRDHKSNQFEIKYRKLGTDFTVTRTCIEY